MSVTVNTERFTRQKKYTANVRIKLTRGAQRYIKERPDAGPYYINYDTLKNILRELPPIVANRVTRIGLIPPKKGVALLCRRAHWGHSIVILLAPTSNANFVTKSLLYVIANITYRLAAQHNLIAVYKEAAENEDGAFGRLPLREDFARHCLFYYYNHCNDPFYEFKEHKQRGEALKQIMRGLWRLTRDN